MSLKEKIDKLKKEVYSIIIDNNWRITIVTLDGKTYSGGLVGQKDFKDPSQDKIVLMNDNSKEVSIYFKDISSVKK
jgi:hypothetical protein